MMISSTTLIRLISGKDKPRKVKNTPKEPVIPSWRLTR